MKPQVLSFMIVFLFFLLFVPQSQSLQFSSRPISTGGKIVPSGLISTRGPILMPGVPQVNFGAIKGVNLIGYDMDENRLSVADYERIKGWGCNVVQFHLPWHLIEPNPGVYDVAFLNKIDEQVSLAGDQSLLVIIKTVVSGFFAKLDSWISEDNLWNNVTVQNRFYELWRMLVNRYKNYDNILAWNLLNEPSAQASNRELAKQLWNGHGEVSSNTISVIRELDSRSIIFMPAPSSSSSFSWLEPVPFENIVYAVSFYEPYSVTHYGKEYDGNYDALKSTWAPAKTFSSAYNVQVWIQEFGINIDDFGGEPPSESRLLWIKHVCTLASEEKIGWCYWLYNDDPKWSFTVLNSDGSERTVVGILKAALSA